MIKRLLIALLLFLILTVNSFAYASTTPLEKKNNYVVPTASESISLLSLTMNLQIQNQAVSVHSTAVFKNKSTTRASVLMGMPKLPYKSMRINSPAIYIDGKKQVVTLGKAPKPAKIQEDPYLTWYTWKANMEPGEVKGIDYSYIISPASIQSFQTFKLPLQLLNAWAEKPGRVTINLQAPFPYSITPDPNIAPNDIAEGRNLTWTFTNQDLKDDLIISNASPDEIALNYMKNIKTEGLKDVIQLYQQKKISLFLEKSQEFLSKNPTAHGAKELKYFMAQSYYLNNDSTSALSLLDEVEKDPGFGEYADLLKSKIAYDKSSIMKELNKDDSSYLSSLSFKSAVMNAWAGNKSQTKKTAALQEIKTVKADSPASPPDQGKKLIKSVKLLGIDIPVEVFFVVFILFVILIVYFVTRKPKYRYYKGYGRHYKNKGWYR